MTSRPQPSRRRTGLVVGGAAVVVLAALAFVVLDVVIAAFVAIFLLTGLVIAVAAHDWDEHPDFEAREHERALRRKEKWERNADARARDRARWEAHHARRAAEAERAEAERAEAERVEDERR